jgi:hypothetical protein
MSKDMTEENKRLRELLKEALPALCDYRVKNEGCGHCKIQHYCLSKQLIPKIEKELKK